MAALRLVTIARLVIGVLLTILLLGLALYDQRNKRVPNKVVRPLLLGAWLVATTRFGMGQLGVSEAVLIVATWGLCITLAWLHVFGGGDMKLVMSLVAFFPDVRLIYLSLGAALAGLLLILGVTERRAGLMRLVALLMTASQGTLPGRAEIAEAYRARGQPITFVFSLAAITYLWFYWVGG
jgi:Flp pilus assembly protein protease CpaA